MNKIVDLLEHHLKKEEIVYEETADDKLFFYVKSITRKNHSYVVLVEGDEWYCDCPSFKYKSGTNKKQECKHIVFIKFLKEKNVKIKKV